MLEIFSTFTTAHPHNCLYTSDLFLTQDFCKEAKLSGQKYEGPAKETIELMHKGQAVSMVYCELEQICPAVVHKEAYTLVTITAQEVNHPLCEYLYTVIFSLQE